MAFRRLGFFVAVLILCCAGPGVCRAAVPIDEAGFTSYVVDALTKSTPDLSFVAAGPLLITVRTHDGKDTNSLYLNRIWQFCSQNPGSCDRAVSSYVTSMLESIKLRSQPIDPTTIRVVVRSTAYLAPAQAGGGEGDRDPAAKPLAGDLWIVCVADSPRSTRVLQNADLKRLKLSIDEAIALGARNTSAALPPLRSTPTKFGGGKFETAMGDPYYESSRIILHDDWAAIAKKMRGQLVVAVPSSGIVIYGNGASARTVEAMREFVPYAAAKSDRPISATLLRWTKDGWEPFAP